MATFRGKRRCDMCRAKADLFAYDGFMLCARCKGTMMGCDSRPSREVKPAVSKARHASEQMQKAKAARSR